MDGPELPIEARGFSREEERLLNWFRQHFGNLFHPDRAIAIRATRECIIAPIVALRIDQQSTNFCSPLIEDFGKRFNCARYNESLIPRGEPFAFGSARPSGHQTAARI